ncbi:MAG: hypothetical protein ACRDT2_12160, partial [Natronosporangium sp.]
VPARAVAAEVARAWPGALTEVAACPPALAGPGGGTVAAYRLAASVPDSQPLTDEPPRRGAVPFESLRPVLEALGKPDGPAVLQVLVRPVSSRRYRQLRLAAARVAKPRRHPAVVVLDGVFGVVQRVMWELLDLLRPGPGTDYSHPDYHQHDRHQPPDPLAAAAMRQAQVKLAAGSHLLAAIRVGAARPERGWAVADARSVIDGYALASTRLRPRRLRLAAARLADRYATGSDWLLCTPAELGTLAHLPADPARYGFDTAALHRRHPSGTPLAEPEPQTRRSVGWTRHGWTTPANPGRRDDPDTGDDNGDDGGDGWAWPGDDPWPDDGPTPVGVPR